MVLVGAAIALGGTAIAQLGTLIHFNCRPNGKCELTREPLIGKLETLYLDRTDLVKTQLESGRLKLVTRSHGDIFLTPTRSPSANQQLLAQRDQIEHFLRHAQAEDLYVRTHRPPQLWYILGGLVIGAGGLGVLLWKSAP